MENTIRSRGTANPAVDAEPITALEIPRTVATRGRPKKLKPMPAMEGLSDVERILFDDFMKEYLTLYPDIMDTDYRILWLAGVKYIQFIRVTAKELKSHQVISMARQHPGVEMRALLDQLDITRKARLKGKPQQGGEDADKLREILYQVSRP